MTRKTKRATGPLSSLTAGFHSWGWRKDRKKSLFFPTFELINRTQGWAANVLVLRKAVLKQN